MVDHRIYKAMAGSIKAYLRLAHEVVGIGLLDSPAAYKDMKAEPLAGKAFYCQMVDKATRGQSFKVANQNFSCDTSARMMGIRPYYEPKEDIDGWYESGFYANRDLAKEQKETVRPIDKDLTGLFVGPLEALTNEPSVVIIHCNPYQAMRLTQAYTYSYGFKKDLALSGMCGVCFESTALPYETGDFAMSLLCSGARFMTKWSENMMMVSFPYKMTEAVLKGLAMTANRAEPDDKKKEIRDQLEANGLSPLAPLNDGEAYYLKG